MLCASQQRLILTSSAQKLQNQLRNQVKITPWKNDFEFDYTGKGLLQALGLFPQPTILDSDKEDSDDDDIPEKRNDLAVEEERFEALKRSIKQVAIWRTRSDHGRIPHSIDSSASLAEILMYDAATNMNIQNSNDAMKCVSSSVLRLSYATTIIRSVNGLADSIQKNRAFPGSNSVANLCKSIGLPIWIVDLRHDAAHNDLPSLVSLRIAAKTLLAFFGENYWNLMEKSRSQQREEALQILSLYKNSAKETSLQTAKRQAEKAANRNETVESDDSESDEEDNLKQNNYGGFSILADTVKKTKEKKRKRIQEKKVKQVTPHSCARKFVKNVPIEIGLETAISYLLWGGVGDAPNGRGALIPGSPNTFPETDEGLQKVQSRFQELLISIASTWPGFTHVLLVNMVDYIFQIENDINARIEGNEILPPNAGEHRKLFFVYAWIEYLLSREFFSALVDGKSIANYHDPSASSPKSTNIVIIDLKKKKSQKWTKDEKMFMQSHAPLEVLLLAEIPLNCLCDRCESMNEVLRYEGSFTKRLINLFCKILGPNRKICLGSIKHVHQKISSCSKIDPEFTVDDEHFPKIIPDEKPEKEMDVQPRPSIDKGDNTMSLEDMEALLSDDDEVINTNPVGENNSTTDSNSAIHVQSTHDLSNHRISTIDEESVRSCYEEKSPWTLCDHWEPCEIGTLPGFAS